MAVATQEPTPRVVEAPAQETSPRLGRVRPLTVDFYERMIAAGLFGKRDRVFLWKGQLVEKMTKNPPHNDALASLNTLMVRIVPDGWHVRPEQPVRLGDDSLPEPDLSIVRGAIRDYSGRRPRAQDLALVIEVSDTSLQEDQGEVLESYADQAIPIYWIANIPHRRIEVYAEPSGPAESPSYRSIRHYGPGEEVPVVLDGREVGRIAVRDVLP